MTSHEMTRKEYEKEFFNMINIMRRDKDGLEGFDELRLYYPCYDGKIVYMTDEEFLIESMMEVDAAILFGWVIASRRYRIVGIKESVEHHIYDPTYKINRD